MSDTPAEPEPKKNPMMLIAIVALVAVVLATAGYWGLKAYKRRKAFWAEMDIMCDCRPIGNAAQQYFLTTGQTTCTFGYNPTTGALSGDITPWLSVIQPGFKFDQLPIESGASHAFTMQRPGAFNNEPAWFTDEGKPAFEWDSEHPNSSPTTPLKKK